MVKVGGGRGVGIPPSFNEDVHFSVSVWRSRSRSLWRARPRYSLCFRPFAGAATTIARSFGVLRFPPFPTMPPKRLTAEEKSDAMVEYLSSIHLPLRLQGR